MRKCYKAWTLLQKKNTEKALTKCYFLRHFSSSGGFIWSITSALSASYALNATLSDLSSAVARHDRGVAGCAKSESEIQRSILHSTARQYLIVCWWKGVETSRQRQSFYPLSPSALSALLTHYFAANSESCCGRNIWFLPSSSSARQSATRKSSWVRTFSGEKWHICFSSPEPPKLSGLLGSKWEKWINQSLWCALASSKEINILSLTAFIFFKSSHSNGSRAEKIISCQQQKNDMSERHSIFNFLCVYPASDRMRWWTP